ncbi:MAG TPA: iron ABC transporter permease, partial [bacterium]|nr:iron ABC transporter permease [bacterium]
MSKRTLLVVMAVFSILFLMGFPFAGQMSLSFDSIFRQGMESRVFWDIRVPRVLSAFIAGSIFALAGMLFQSMFRNDLATPYTLGISSGAALGAVIAIKFLKTDTVLYYPAIQIFSFGAALATVAVLHMLTLTRKRGTSHFLLLAGIAINFTCTGAILFIQYIAFGSESSRMIRWMMGSLDFIGYSPILKLIPALILLLGTALYFHRDLDLLSIDSDIAHSRGVNLKITEKALFFIVSLAVAVTVANTGPIGFVGMVAPHIGRKLIGRE